MRDDVERDDIVWWTEPVLESNTSRPLPTLPDEIIVEILLRLPVKSLLQFRSVCYSWKTIISDAQFAKDHIQRSMANPTMTHQQLVTSTLNYSWRIIFCPVQNLFKPIHDPVAAIELRMRCLFKILGSCNGLLCLFDIDKQDVRLWNPSIRLRSERSPIVKSSPNSREEVQYYGFGYDHMHNKYKVLMVVGKYNQPVAKVYTFGANSWRTVQGFPCPNVHRLFSTDTAWLGKFVSGTLNWLAREDSISNPHGIISFDLGEETFCELSLPIKDDDGKRCEPELGVLRNCLCVCFEDKKSPHWVVWLMTEYGVQESWIKLVTIPRTEVELSGCRRSLELLFMWENGFLLGKTRHSELVLYNSNNGQLKHPLCVAASESDSIFHIYHESLISPLQ